MREYARNLNYPTNSPLLGVELPNYRDGRDGIDLRTFYRRKAPTT
jgi:hypothetical protein